MYQINTNNLEFKIGSNEMEYGKLYYMKEYNEKILNLDIKNFNYIIYDDDIDNTTFDEFYQYYEDMFLETLYEINKYLYVDLSNFSKDNDLEKNKMVIKNIVRFYMMGLPYTYLKSILKEYQIGGFHDALEVINQSNNKANIIKAIEKAIDEQYSFVELMKNVNETVSNKSKKENMLELIDTLDSNVNNKVKVLNYFKSIISASGEEGIRELLKIYLKNDYINII